jgi:hypothetical protein
MKDRLSSAAQQSSGPDRMQPAPQVAYTANPDAKSTGASVPVPPDLPDTLLAPGHFPPSPTGLKSPFPVRPVPVTLPHAEAVRGATRVDSSRPAVTVFEPRPSQPSQPGAAGSPRSDGLQVPPPEGEVPDPVPGGRGGEIGPPHRGEANSEFNPGANIPLARAMANRILEEDKLDEVALFGDYVGTDYSSLEVGIQTGIALLALKPENAPTDVVEIAKVAYNVDDVDQNALAVMKEPLEPGDIVQPLRQVIVDTLTSGNYAFEISVYQHLRTNAAEVSDELSQSGHADATIEKVFDNPEWYKLAFQKTYGNVSRFVEEQKERLQQSGFRNEAEKIAEDHPVIEQEIVEKATAQNERQIKAKIASRARRMFGDSALEDLPVELANWL